MNQIDCRDKFMSTKTNHNDTHTYIMTTTIDDFNDERRNVQGTYYHVKAVQFFVPPESDPNDSDLNNDYG